MPPKRAHPRSAQPEVVQSDYDTDNAYHTDLPQAHAHPPPSRTNEEINLSVIQRHDKSVSQILSVAPFAVVYLFSPESQQWEKCGIEGTLFVCQLQPQMTPENSVIIERYSVVILNRKGLENFSTELLSASNVEITEQFVILQVAAEDGTPQIFGLWIFSEPAPASTAQSREINAQIIQECASRAESSRLLAGQSVGSEEDPEEDGEEEREQEVQPAYAQETMPPSAGQQINVGNLFAHAQGNGHFQQEQQHAQQHVTQGFPPPQYDHQAQQQHEYYQRNQELLQRQQHFYQQQQEMQRQQQNLHYQQPPQPQYYQQQPQQMYGAPQGDTRAPNSQPAQANVLLGLFKGERQGY